MGADPHFKANETSAKMSLNQLAPARGVRTPHISKVCPRLAALCGAGMLFFRLFWYPQPTAVHAQLDAK
jgi:hypothetical protein